MYRIPLGENIVYKHSFCPNCKHKLAFKDLIPVFSYLFLGGKCAYCGKKIRIRYLLLEILSGIIFLGFALSLNKNIFYIDSATLIKSIFYILYIATLFIIAGIDKDNIKIQKSLLIFGLVLSICYMIYVCISDQNAIYTYIIYLIFTALLLFANIIFTKKKKYESYTIGVLMLMLYMSVYTKSIFIYETVILTLIFITIQTLTEKISKKEESSMLKIPIGFYLCISNIFFIILENFLCNWVI